MSAREIALRDIQDDLNKENKQFINFRSNLNSVMRRLVSNHIKQQQCKSSNSLWAYSKANSQLVARCLFSFATEKATLCNYNHYYDNEKA